MSAGCDVAVIGGGSAGLAAAVTAAREGASVLLIEQYGFLGGMGTASLVHTFCGLYLLRSEPGAVLANPGFPSEMAERMIAATGVGPVRMGRVDVLPQHPVEFARIADDVTAAERTLDVRWHSELTALRRDGDGWRLGGWCRGTGWEVTAATVVDASGDAVAASLLGAQAELTESPRLQRPAYVFGVNGAATLDEPGRLRLSGLLVQGVREGRLDRAALGLTFRSSGRPGEIFGTVDLAAGEAAYDPLDSRCLSGLEREGRAVASAAVGLLRERFDGWESAYVSHWPVRAGVRESRRWQGLARFSGRDLEQGVRSADEIALATWPMEFRENARGPKLRFPAGDRPAGIPLGCLRVADDRLFVAGRCLSADHEAQASIRVMGTCFATGQAAGLAAAVRAAGGEVERVPALLAGKFGPWPA